MHTPLRREVKNIAVPTTTSFKLVTSTSPFQGSREQQPKLKKRLPNAHLNALWMTNRTRNNFQGALRNSKKA